MHRRPLPSVPIAEICARYPVLRAWVLDCGAVISALRRRSNAAGPVFSCASMPIRLPMPPRAVRPPRPPRLVWPIPAIASALVMSGFALVRLGFGACFPHPASPLGCSDVFTDCSGIGVVRWQLYTGTRVCYRRNFIRACQDNCVRCCSRLFLGYSGSRSGHWMAKVLSAWVQPWVPGPGVDPRFWLMLRMAR